MMSKIYFDHSQTYKKLSFKNFFHRNRLKRIIRVLDRAVAGEKMSTYADFGSSNGFITQIIAKRYNIQNTYAFDHSKDHIKFGSNKYKDLNFTLFDLNKKNKKIKKFDLVTSFETLEHVSNLNNSLDNILVSAGKNSLILLTVPIETGLRGIAKLIIKLIIEPRHKFSEDLDTTKLGYLWSLISNKDISSLRKKKEKGFGSHRGFQYLHIDKRLKNKHVNFKAFNDITSRYYLIKSQTNSKSGVFL